MPEQISLPDLMRPGVLQARLEKVYGKTPNGSISISLIHEGQFQRGAIGEERLLPVGCITKLFTATLAGMAIDGKHFRLQTAVADLLGDSAALAERLAGITVRQLLEHTHGLDYSRMKRAPLLEDGRIDTAALREDLGARRLFDSGSYYSYGSGGTWVLCAILERTFGLPYTRLLRRHLCEPLGIELGALSSADTIAQARVCPALGENLALSSRDFVRFLQYHLAGGKPWCLGSAEVAKLTDELVALPGWSPLECGVRLSWKHFGSGWFGHNSILPGAPTLIRLHPRRGVGLLIACTQHAPMSVANAVLANALPDYPSIHMPKLLSAEEALGIDCSRFVGTYENASATFDVSGNSGSSLEVKVRRKQGDLPERDAFFTARLRPARDHIFFTQPADPRLVPFAQFVQPEDNSFAYLWNGTSLWPRRSGA
jgi:hypothetical protein